MHLRAEEEKSRQLAESRERFQTTLNSLGDAVIATDAEGIGTVHQSRGPAAYRLDRLHPRRKAVPCGK